jgi:hypothetical protein
MGIGIHLKSRDPTAPLAPKPPLQMVERHATAARPPLQGPFIDSFESNPELASSKLSIAPSMQSTQSSYLDEIKHEVMVNYLYQQQCSRLWVSDGSGEVEGVLLRKARNRYLACPPALTGSVFAMVCAELNVQVSYVLRHECRPD